MDERLKNLIAAPPMEIAYDPANYMAKFIQELNIRVNQEVIRVGLTFATEKQLQDELKRRVEMRKAAKETIYRCRDCRHCIQGYTSKSSASRGYKTSVCELRPKDKEGRYCFYATLQSRKACEMFESK